MAENTIAFRKGSGKKVFAERKKNHTTKRTLEQLIEDTLFKEDMGLLHVICDTATVVGDAAAMWSKGILKILSNRVDQDGVQMFLKQSLKNRILDYRAKSRDLSDITRDNSLVTMLLTAYGRREGEAYLSQTLTKPLNSIYPILSKCEVDPQKLAKKQSTPKGSGENVAEDNAEIDAEISVNRKNLEQACERVFQAIFESRDKLPKTILSLCCFLTNTIEEVSLIDPTTIPRKVTVESRESSASNNQSGKMILKQGSADALSSSPTALHNSRISRASTSIFRIRHNASFSNKLTNMLNMKKKVGPRYSNENISITPGRANRSSLGPTSAPASSNALSAKLPLVAPSSLAKNVEAESSITEQNVEPSNHKDVACSIPLPASPRESTAISPGDNTASTIDAKKAHSSKDEAASQAVNSMQEIKSGDDKNSPTKLVGKASSDESVQSSSKPPKKTSPREGSFQTASLRAGSFRNRSGSKALELSLGLSEKIIGSFLFLRFIVPGITSPDANGILIEKITPAARRGLVLCGKMMTALCNDTEFGYKETSLMPCNPFLENYRSQMKDFLRKSAQMVTEPTSLSIQISKPDRIFEGPTSAFASCKSEFDLKDSLVKTHIHPIPSTDESSHNRAASHPLPDAESNAGGDGNLTSLKGKAFSRSLENMKASRRAESGSNGDIPKSGVSTAVDPDIATFYHSLANGLEKLEKDILWRQSTMSQSSFQRLVKSYGELRLYLNTGGYVEDHDQNFKSKKSWWVKMMHYLVHSSSRINSH